MKTRKIKPKKGQTFWTCSVCEGEVSFEDWFVRSIQNRTRMKNTAYQYKRTIVYMVRNIKGVTWIKRSKKHFDWGWDKYIPEWCRLNFRLGEDGAIEDDWRAPYTTQLQAARACLKSEREMLTLSENDLEHSMTADEAAEHEKWVAEYTRGIAAVKRAITREQSKRKKR